MPPFSEVASVTIKSVARSDGCVERALRRGFRKGMGSWGGSGAGLEFCCENTVLKGRKLAGDCLVVVRARCCARNQCSSAFFGSCAPLTLQSRTNTSSAPYHAHRAPITHQSRTNIFATAATMPQFL